MKKRTAIIGALVSLMPMGQMVLIQTGAALTSAAVMLSVSEKAKGESAAFYYNRAQAKLYLANYSGSIPDSSKTIQLDPQSWEAYDNRGAAHGALAMRLMQYLISPSQLRSIQEMLLDIRIVVLLNKRLEIYKVPVLIGKKHLLWDIKIL